MMEPVQRRIIGIAGCPGAGKSTMAARLASEHATTSVVVPMDGFHLAQRELERLGRADRKGAPDTFDVDGFAALLRRLRADGSTVYAPAFDRHLEEPIAGAIAVEPRHELVVTEGNYLLHDRDGWEQIRPLLDECWYVEVDDELRVQQLTARHIEHGRSPAEAAEWVRRVDEPNAVIVRAGRARADRVVGIDDPALPDGMDRTDGATT